MSANIRELAIGMSKAKQTDIASAVAGTANYHVLRWNDPPVPIAQYINESDEGFTGKGDEFATQLFPSHKRSNFSLAGHLSAEKLAVCGMFGIGGAKTGAGPFVYTCAEYNPVTAGIERPYMTLVSQMRPGGSPIIDQSMAGLMLAGFRVSLRQGPGLDNATINVDFRGTGDDTLPSGVVLPALATEHLLNAGSLTLTVIGVDYITLRRVVSLEWGWTNEIDEEGSIFPGSGVQDGFAIAGRLEVVRRIPVLTFTVRLDTDSAELAKLKAQTTGTVVIAQTFDVDEKYTCTFQKVGIETAEIGNANGIVTIACTCRPMKHAANGVIDLVVTTNTDGIAQVAV